LPLGDLYVEQTLTLEQSIGTLILENVPVHDTTASSLIQNCCMLCCVQELLECLSLFICFILFQEKTAEMSKTIEGYALREFFKLNYNKMFLEIVGVTFLLHFQLNDICCSGCMVTLLLVFFPLSLFCSFFAVFVLPVYTDLDIFFCKLYFQAAFFPFSLVFSIFLFFLYNGYSE